MAAIGAEEESFVSESDFIKNLLKLGSRARDIMTPRTVVIAADADTSQAFHGAHPNLRFSRIQFMSTTTKTT